MNLENSIYLSSIPLISQEHGNELLKALYDQQRKSELCDVSLVVENVTFPAHKAVLAAYSTYFHALFDRGRQSDDAGSKACSVTTIHLSSINTCTFIPILYFLYTSRLHLFSENIRDVMRSARKLQIMPIIQACERLISQNVTLPSIKEARDSSSEHVVARENRPSQSVLYVDLKSEDDEDYHHHHSGGGQEKGARSQDAKLVSQSQLPVAVEDPESQDQARARGWPMKKQRAPKKKSSQHKKSAKLTAEVASLPPPVMPPSSRNISALSPVSIFGRSGNRAPPVHSNLSTSMLSTEVASTSGQTNKASLMSSQCLPPVESLPFDSSLEPLTGFFGAESTLMLDPLAQDSMMSPPAANLEKVLTNACIATSPKPSDHALQVHSVFSMSPKPSAKQQQQQVEAVQHDKQVVVRNATTLLQAADCLTTQPAIDASRALAAMIITTTTSAGGFRSSGSIYTCKECYKYFSDLNEAINHFCVMHPALAQSYVTATKMPAGDGATGNGHGCPHCGRLFNNKNNLKRHILIKHTTDKRFKCNICGRKYAIRQSLQYHMRSIHRSDVIETASTDVTPQHEPTSSTSQHEPTVSSSTSPRSDDRGRRAAEARRGKSSSVVAPTFHGPSYSFPVAIMSEQAVASSGSMEVACEVTLPTSSSSDTFLPTSSHPPASSYLTSAPIVCADDKIDADANSNGKQRVEQTTNLQQQQHQQDETLPTIQRIESIRSTEPSSAAAHDVIEEVVNNYQDQNSSAPSDSRNLVKAEPHGAIANSSRPPNGFPDMNVAVAARRDNFSDSALQSVNTACLTSSRLITSSLTGGNPFVLSGTSNLPTLLPAITTLASGDFPPTRDGDDLHHHSMLVNRVVAGGAAGSRLHRCDHCSRIFPTSNAFSRHKRACNKHECPICHRGFSQMGNMRRHIKIYHSGQKPFQCKVCNKAYGIQQSFRYHMRDKHGINVTGAGADAGGESSTSLPTTS